MYKRIRDLREDMDLKQGRIWPPIFGAARWPIPIMSWASGTSPTDVLCRLADYYRVSVDYLLGRTDIREAYPRK